MDKVQTIRKLLAHREKFFYQANDLLDAVEQVINSRKKSWTARELNKIVEDIEDNDIIRNYVRVH